MVLEEYDEQLTLDGAPPPDWLIMTFRSSATHRYQAASGKK